MHSFYNDVDGELYFSVIIGGSSHNGVFRGYRRKGAQGINQNLYIYLM